MIRRMLSVLQRFAKNLAYELTNYESDEDLIRRLLHEHDSLKKTKIRQ